MNTFCGVCEEPNSRPANSAANGLVSRLAEVDILQEMTGQKRHRIFRYGPYLDLFVDG